MPEYLPILFFIVALIYSSAGFGGGSSYLAILSILLTDFYEIRSSALILNIIVVSIGTFIFIRNKRFDFQKFWPFLILSVPFAYAGAQFRLSESTYFIALGISLCLAALMMSMKLIRGIAENQNLNKSKKIGIGAAIGLLSGLTGIGGGIFLSPVLHLIKWSDARIIAALTSVFILANSTAGLLGVYTSGLFQFNRHFLFPLIAAVICGSILGSFLNNYKLSNRVLILISAILILYAGLRLLLKYSFGILI